MDADSTAPRRNSSGLARDVEILELLGGAEAEQAGGLGVMRIAQLTGRDKAVISRSLATLADAGLLDRDPATLNYRLGSRIFSLAARTLEAALIAESRPLLRRIARSTRETTHLCVLRGGNVLTVLSELSPHEVRTTGWEGVITAAWRTPSGRVLISDWDRASLSAWYDEHGHDRPVVGPVDPMMAAAGFSVLEEPPAEKAIVSDFESLLQELSRIRERGYATLDEELERGVVGASAPVHDYSGRIVAAVNVSAPKARIGEQLDKLGMYVSQAASELSDRLGAAARPAK
ncbi:MULTISPECIES: IclR family transcriptional regulator [unclassified Rathayibacter]|uniref:IclR family transcriptional regulator n=1 Tax=unclassified Rathayibacter TaxID=2609250 RepID=UPI000F4B20E9|nr:MULTISPECIES: IclR family transcriptional regulator [unclassified Rathayibacter]ROP49122.1 IclR family transcriptional regulator [Rathayibacter sp. PhB186]ROS50761.1 IclR family transcriptional regulator [Rathayibacter sp. PhB185]